jgi:iron-sulfur cluster assembly protein
MRFAPRPGRRRSKERVGRVAGVTRHQEGAIVLAITPSAAEAIKEVLTSSGLDDGAGLRIARPADGDEPGAGFELSVATLPAEDDQVVEEHGAQVFLEPKAADVLDDRKLDADSRGDQVRFVLEAQ